MFMFMPETQWENLPLWSRERIRDGVFVTHLELELHESLFAPLPRLPPAFTSAWLRECAPYALHCQCCQVGEKFVAQILMKSSPKVAQNFLN